MYSQQTIVPAIIFVLISISDPYTKRNNVMLQTTKSQFKKPQPHMQFFWNRNEHCKQLPAYYVILAMLAALVGYCFILGFPILFVVSIYDTAALLPFYPVFGNLTETLGWITLSIFLGHVSYNILTADFTNIPGLKIKRNSDGRLMQLLDDIQVEYTQPKIRQIIITQEFELKLIKIPHFGLPILADNILVIGYAGGDFDEFGFAFANDKYT